METKTGGSVKDVDKQRRIVTGYFTSTGTLDSDDDIFADGAFKKTISELGPQGKKRIWHLWQHDAYSPINKPLKLEEQKAGVYYETIFPKTAIADLALELYQAGAITEHSVGFNVIDEEQKSEHRLIKQVRMWEGSTVLWGANENTPTVAVKGEEIMKRMNVLEKLLKDGSFEDHVFQLIMIEIENLKSAMTSLEPPQAPQPRPEQDEVNKYLLTFQNIL